MPVGCALPSATQHEAAALSAAPSTERHPVERGVASVSGWLGGCWRAGIRPWRGTHACRAGGRAVGRACGRRGAKTGGPAARAQGGADGRAQAGGRAAQAQAGG